MQRSDQARQVEAGQVMADPEQFAAGGEGSLGYEPGLYVAPAPDIDPKWWNIGVRIEDDVLVTDDGPVVLSAGAPKEIERIERLMEEEGLGNSARGRLGGSNR